MLPDIGLDKIIYPDRPIYIGLSGGLDSVFLSFLVNEWAKKKGIVVNAIHINHGLSPDAASWEDFVTSFCVEHGISLQIERVNLEINPGDSVEAVAREARYKAFDQLTETGAQILTGHHQDDQLETMLLALKRGGGGLRLGGMSQTIGLSDGKTLVRPLLSVPRKVIQDEARALGLAWVDDQSNFDNVYDRNFLRNEVIPLLKERWPGILSAASRTAATLQSEQAIISIHADQILTRCMDDQKSLVISELDSLHVEERKLAIRHWIRLHGFVPVREDRLEKIYLEVAKARADRHPEYRANQWCVRRSENCLVIRAV
jgi:tRNA(Ile)-lysidine synthase